MKRPWELHALVLSRITWVIFRFDTALTIQARRAQAKGDRHEQRTEFKNRHEVIDADRDDVKLCRELE